MNRISRRLLVGALTLFLLGSACNAVTEMFSAPPGTAMPAATVIASATPAGLSDAPSIPITGESVVYMQCQFCVGAETRAVLIFPDTAFFDVDRSSPATCLTADVVNGRRILICRGPQSASFNLNICSDSSNCLQFPVALQPCDLLQTRPAAPFFLDPVKEDHPDDDLQPVDPIGPTQQAEPSIPTSAPPTVPPPPPPPSGEEEGDVVICHIPPGNPENRKTMTVSRSAWQNEHSKHGDTLGACP